MSGNSIHLKALAFDDPEAGPTQVTASFPADTLYALATLVGQLPPLLFRNEAYAHLGGFYGFVSTYVANRFYEDGLNDAMPRFDLLDGQYTLTYHETGTKAADSPRQLLAGHLFMAIADHLGASASQQTNHERRELAEALAQTVINFGWRQVTSLRQS